jgi:TldD protein
MLLNREEIYQRLTETIKRQAADYIEARFEESESTQIQYQGKELENVGSLTTTGGNVRAQVGGGWGFVSFNELGELKPKIELAVSQARLVAGKNGKLTPAEPVRDMVEAEVKKDPSKIPLSQKKRLLDEYNDIIWSIPRIQTSLITYQDKRRRTTFINSQGSHIEQERSDVSLRLAAVARDRSELEQAGISVGSSGDFSVVEGLHDRVRELSRRAVEMLSAPRVKGGEYTVVLDPVLAGVFAHEAFGHLSEADFVYENDPRPQVRLGKSEHRRRCHNTWLAGEL